MPAGESTTSEISGFAYPVRINCLILIAKKPYLPCNRCIFSHPASFYSEFDVRRTMYRKKNEF